MWTELLPPGFAVKQCEICHDASLLVVIYLPSLTQKTKTKAIIITNMSSAFVSDGLISVFSYFFPSGYWSDVQDHRQDVPVTNSHAGAAPHVGRHRHLGTLHAHVILQQLPRCCSPLTLPVPCCDPACSHRAAVPQGFHPRFGYQHHPLPLHLLAAQLQWWGLISAVFKPVAIASAFCHILYSNGEHIQKIKAIILSK